MFDHFAIFCMSIQIRLPSRPVTRMNFNPNFEQIGNAFVAHYYSKFDVQDAAMRATAMADLYDPDNSYLTFEGVQMRGRQAILEKFGVRSASCFSKIHHSCRRFLSNASSGRSLKATVSHCPTAPSWWPSLVS